tara:strand:- start:472 stop:741 length:270 start_codon:yes stop_codon:yes gene_type:complete
MDIVYLIFGYIGSLIAIIMMFPQVYLTLKTQKTEDISIKTISMNLTAQLFFLPYSIYFELYPLLCANISLALCDIIIIIIYFKNKEYYL